MVWKVLLMDVPSNKEKFQVLICEFMVVIVQLMENAACCLSLSGLISSIGFFFFPFFFFWWVNLFFPLGTQAELMDLMAWLLAAFGGDMHSQEQDCAELNILSFEMERLCHRKGGSSSWCVMHSVVCGVPWSVCLCVFVCMRGCLCLFTCTGMMMDIVAKLESHSSFLPVCLLSPCIHLKLSTSSQVRPSPAQHKPETQISVKAKINCCAELNIHIYKYIQTYMRTFYSHG